MKRIEAIALTLVTSAALTACAYTSVGGRGPIGPSTQIVTGKNPPHILYAAEASYCEVSDDKFKKTEVGSSTFCVWRSSDDKRPGVPAATPGRVGH